MVELRRLDRNDIAAAEAFLLDRMESSVYPLIELHRARRADEGEAFRGRYAGAFEADRLTGVVCQAGNGMGLLQAPGPAEPLVPALLDCCLAGSRRPLTGLIGPWPQVEAGKAHGAAGRRVRHVTHGLLLRLDLERLQVPAALADDGLSCRPARESEVALLSDWRAHYEIETMDAAAGPALDAEAKAKVARLQRGGLLWVLETDGQAVSMIAINARYRGAVLLGGGYTPPAQRGRGYARLTLAGTLDCARAAGRSTALFVTAKDNRPAQRAYAAAGFQTVGEQGMLLYETDPQ